MVQQELPGVPVAAHHNPNDHYDIGGISTIDVIRAKLTRRQYEGFLLGNIIKYSTRLNFKGASQKDASKLAEYADWLDKHLNRSSTTEEKSQ